MTTWWNKNINENDGNKKEEFASWLKDHREENRVYCRNYISQKGYKTFLDCGCGLAVEYYGFKADNYDIKYVGLDSCKYLLKSNKLLGIDMIEAELESNFPIEDNSYECVYARAIIEHLSYYETTISELIRVGSKEVIISWFIKPDEKDDEINYWSEEDLYHNKYNLTKLEKFILSNDKVDNIVWKKVEDAKHPDHENVLHIILK